MWLEHDVLLAPPHNSAPKSTTTELRTYLHGGTSYRIDPPLNSAFKRATGYSTGEDLAGPHAWCKLASTAA